MMNKLANSCRLTTMVNNLATSWKWTLTNDLANPWTWTVMNKSSNEFCGKNIFVTFPEVDEGEAEVEEDWKWEVHFLFRAKDESHKRRRLDEDGGIRNDDTR